MVLDIICGVLIIGLAVLGGFRGFTRQVLKIFGWFVGFIGAFFLLKPVFGLLCGMDFFSNLIVSLGEKFEFMSFMDKFAATTPAGTTGMLFAEYIFKFVLFIILWIVISLVYKLIRKLIAPIADLPIIRIFDRILGALLGIVWACLIIFVVLYIAEVLNNHDIATMKDAIYNLASGGTELMKKYVLDNFDKVSKGFVTAVDFIKGSISTVVA